MHLCELSLKDSSVINKKLGLDFSSIQIRNRVGWGGGANATSVLSHPTGMTRSKDNNTKVCSAVSWLRGLGFIFIC